MLTQHGEYGELSELNLIMNGNRWKGVWLQLLPLEKSHLERKQLIGESI